jgi:hypothetical protein
LVFVTSSVCTLPSFAGLVKPAFQSPFEGVSPPIDVAASWFARSEDIVLYVWADRADGVVTSYFGVTRLCRRIIRRCGQGEMNNRMDRDAIESGEM